MLANKRILYAMPLLMLMASAFIKSDAPQTTTTTTVTTKAYRYTDAWKPFSNAVATTVKAPNAYSDVLYPGQSIYQGQYIMSPNGVFYVFLQFDGNLVLYFDDEQTYWWHSQTHGNPQITHLDMQTDGNLVLYDDNMTPYWHTHTHVYPNGHAVMTNCGEFKVVQSGQTRWSTNTCWW
jgi:hypothetical protein